MRRHSSPCLFSSLSLLHYDTRWLNYILCIPDMLSFIYKSFAYILNTCLHIPNDYYMKLRHHFGIFALLSVSLTMCLILYWISINVLIYLSDWLEIPRASLHVTLGPAFQPAITSLLDPYYLTLDSQLWLPTYSNTFTITSFNDLWSPCCSFIH